MLNIRKPNIYRDNICKRCFKKPETNEHIICCEKAQGALSGISTEIWKKIQADKRREERWDLQKLKQIIFKATEEESQIQSIEWLREILNKSDVEKAKEVIGAEKSTIRFWCIVWNF